MKVDHDAPVLEIDSGTPTVEEALERLAGRRAAAIERDARVVYVEKTVGQNRHTRRNNLRIARAEMRERAKAQREAEGRAQAVLKAAFPDQEAL